MELRHYLQILGRRKWTAIAVAATTILVVAVGTYLEAPLYTASVTIRVAQVQDNTVNYYDLSYSERLINTYVELVQSRPFLEQSIGLLGLDIPPDSLKPAVKVEAIPNTELLRISVENERPETAAGIANTLGELLVEEREKLYSGQGKSAQEILLDQLATVESGLEADRDRLQVLMADQTTGRDETAIQELTARIDIESQTYSTILEAYDKARLSDEARANSLSIVEPAVPPSTPSQPKVVFNLALATLVGFAGAIGCSLLVENLDTAIYSTEDLEKPGEFPLLGSIPNLRVPRKLRGAPLLIRSNGKSSAGEAFRLLSSSILSLDSGWSPRTVLITSIGPDDGKSTVLANLAGAVAQGGRNVVVVDSDMRAPKLDRLFGVSNGLGLKNVIAQQVELEAALQHTSIPRVRIVASGPLPNNPAELLGLPKMREVIDHLTTQADVILLDSPPLSRFADAVVLAPMVDSVVLVVARGSASAGQIRKTMAQLAKVGARQLGLVFNRAETAETAYSNT